MKNLILFFMSAILFYSCAPHVIPADYILLKQGQEFYIKKDDFTGVRFIKHKSTFPPTVTNVPNMGFTDLEVKVTN